MSILVYAKNGKLGTRVTKARQKRPKPNSALLEVSAFDAPFLSEKLLQCFIFNSKGKQYYSEKPRIHTKTPVGNFIAK